MTNRARPQEGPFAHCLACHAPIKSRPIVEGIYAQIDKAKAFDWGSEYIAKIEKRLDREYYGAYEELCPRCLDAALNPPTQDGIEMDGLYWEREAEAVIQAHYDSLGVEVPWED